MGFNYGLEKRKFTEEWKKLYSEYKAAGMSEEDIQDIYAFDLNVFRKNRTEFQRTQPLSESSCDDGTEQGESMSALLKKFSSALSACDKYSFQSDPRFAWVDEMENDELYRKIISLPERDMKIRLKIEYRKSATTTGSTAFLRKSLIMSVLVIASSLLQEIASMINLAKVISGFSQMCDLQSNQVNISVHSSCDLLRGISVLIDVLKYLIGIKKDFRCNDVRLVFRLRGHVVQHKLLQCVSFGKVTVQLIVTKLMSADDTLHS